MQQPHPLNTGTPTDRSTFRVCVSMETVGQGDDAEIVFAFRELYTGADGGIGWTAEQVGLSANTPNDLQEELQRRSDALHLPLLDLTEDEPDLLEPLLPPAAKRAEPTTTDAMDKQVGDTIYEVLNGQYGDFCWPDDVVTVLRARGLLADPA